jgi:serine/threonine-protein kinase
VVYAALYEQQQREVAIKVLDQASARHPVAVERFLREAATVSSLDHGHIVGVSDFGRLADGRPFLVMPRVPGRDLTGLLTQEGVLSPRRAAALLEGVASALDAVHAAGLVHRDLKPENLMHVCDDAGHETALLLDFGIAVSSAATLDDPEGLLGTPEFMSPEALAGERVDHLSDVYALASVVFELITGELPFVGKDPRALLRAKCRGAGVPRTLSQAAGRDFSKALEAVLARGLARQPDARHPSASAFVRELAEAAASEPDEAPRRALREVRIERAPTLVGTSGRALERSPRLLRRSTRVVWNAPASKVKRALAVSGVTAARKAAPKPPAPLASAVAETPPKSAPPPVSVAPRATATAPAPVTAPAVATVAAPLDTFRPPQPLEAEEEAPAPREVGRKLAYACALALPLVVWLAWPGPSSAPPPEHASPVASDTFAPPDAPARAAFDAVAPTVVAAGTSIDVPEPPAAPDHVADGTPEPPPAESIPTAPSKAELAAPTNETTSSRPAPRARARAASRPSAATATETATVAVLRPTEPRPSAPDLTARATDALLRGDFESARKGLRAALAIDPRHAPAWRGLGLLQERSGDRAEAARALRRYLALQPDARDAARVRARLQALDAAASR